MSKKTIGAKFNESIQALTFLLAGFLAAAPALAGSPPMNVLPAEGVYLNSNRSPLLPLLKNARKSIDIEIYTMSSPTVRSLLRQALARNVKVRILKDPKPLGEKCDTFAASTGASAGDSTAEADCADQQKLVADVRAAGGTFAPFDKHALCPNGGGKGGTSCYEHGKIALADGLALLSTGNFDSSNLCIDGTRRCNRDFSMISADTAVYDTLENFFEADLRGVSYEVDSLIPAALQGKLTVSPASLKPLVAFIDSAQDSIDLEAQYLKDPDLNGAIQNAARRGVKVSLTVASACAFGTPAASVQKEITAVYGAFDRDGISSSFFNASNKINGAEGYMHAKVIVVDGKRAWVGSVNGSTTSLTQNREYGLIFDTPTSVKTVLEIVRADHVSSNSETWQESLNCGKDSKKE